MGKWLGRRQRACLHHVPYTYWSLASVVPLLVNEVHNVCKRANHAKSAKKQTRASKRDRRGSEINLRTAHSMFALEKTNAKPTISGHGWHLPTRKYASLRLYHVIATWNKILAGKKINWKESQMKPKARKFLSEITPACKLERFCFSLTLLSEMVHIMWTDSIVLRAAIAQYPPRSYNGRLQRNKCRSFVCLQEKV